MTENTLSLWSAIVVAQHSSNGKLQEVLESVEELSPPEKTELMKRLLGTSGVNITFGNQQMSGDVIVQINAADRETLADVLRAVSNRIKGP